MRSGLPLTQLVEFTDGFPDGDITWELLDGTGASVANDTVTPEAGAASAVVALTGAQNTIEADTLSSPRELQWSYTVGGIIHADRFRYRLDAFLPLGVSEDGVRRKLGIEEHELEDEAIDLPTAYGRFQAKVGADALAAVSGYQAQLARDAIEATAAVTLIPSLQISLAVKESSGTSQYQRGDIDWDQVRGQLEQFILDGTAAVNPNLDPTANYGAILIPVVRNDPLTGADATG